MSVIAGISRLIAAWSVDIYAGWSIMDVFTVLAVLFVMSSVINFFYAKAK